MTIFKPHVGRSRWLSPGFREAKTPAPQGAEPLKSVQRSFASLGLAAFDARRRVESSQRLIMRVLGALALAALTGANAFAETKYIKFATLAPEGSTWMNVMNELGAELSQKTGGALKFKFYSGGVSGDEKDVVKKLRIGQLQAAGLTGVGLGEITPEVRILDAPWLCRSQREADRLHKLFDAELAAAVEKSGYVVLGWTEVGFVYVFSKKAVNGPQDMKDSKMWVWDGDPIAQAAYKAIGVSPIPLSVVDVMSSLETGLIDAVYGPPMGVVALQWFTRTKYIYNVPIAHSSGAVLLSKKFFDALSAEEQKLLLEVGAKHLKRLNRLTVEENDQAMRALQKQGLILSSRPDPQTMKFCEELGLKARRELAGKLYPPELLDRVEKALQDYRRETP